MSATKAKELRDTTDAELIEFIRTQRREAFGIAGLRRGPPLVLQGHEGLRDVAAAGGLRGSLRVNDTEGYQQHDAGCEQLLHRCPPVMAEFAGRRIVEAGGEVQFPVTTPVAQGTWEHTSADVSHG